MSETKTIRIIAAMDAQLETKAQVTYDVLSLRQRTLNALTILGIIWLVGVLCVLIPVLHFFLVPGALIAGIAFGARKFNLQNQMHAGEVTCPKCTKPVALETKPFNWPKRQLCPHCQTRILFVLD